MDKDRLHIGPSKDNSHPGVPRIQRESIKRTVSHVTERTASKAGKSSMLNVHRSSNPYC